MIETNNQTERLYPGKDTTYTPINKQIYQYMAEPNYQHDNDKALTYFGKQIAFGEFINAIEKAAISFRMLGVEKGDYVPICSPNIPQGIISFYALNKIGAIPDMIPVLASEEEFKHYLTEIPAKRFVMFRDFFPKVASVIPKTSIKKTIIISPSTYVPDDIKRMADLKTILNEIKYEARSKSLLKNDRIDWNTFMNLSNGENPVATVEHDINKTALIAHTGGTTGLSKGAEITNENFNAMVSQYKIIGELFERNDKILTVLPIFINFGLCNNIHMPLSFGIETIIVPTFDPKEAFDLFLKYRPNHFMCVAHYFEYMMNDPRFENYDLSHLKTIVYGGAPMKRESQKRFNEWLSTHGAKDVIVTNGYGMTEATSSVAYEQKNAYTKDYKLIQLPYTEIKIVDHDTKEEKKIDEEGEIYVAGPTVFKGYYGKPEETNKVIHVDENGKKWLITGDLGRLTPEGELKVVGRIKRIYPTMDTSNGNVAKIFPDIIENCIQSLESVSECTIECREHQERVNVPFLYVVLKEGYDQEEAHQQIKNKCLELNDYSRPYSIFFVKALKKTASKKIDHLFLTKQIPENYQDLIPEEIYSEKKKNSKKK